MGSSSHARLRAGNVVSWRDVDAPDTDAVRFRREMERHFSAAPGPAQAAQITRE